MMICPEDNKIAGYIDGVQTMEITENGDYSWRPGDGFQGLAGVDVSVEIPEKMKVGGMKFGYSSEIDTSKYDWSDVEDFSYMFYNYQGYEKFDLTDVVTSKATNTSHMFYGARNLFAFDSELDKMDTSNVTDMSSMFENMNNLVALVIYFDTSNVTDMSRMFAGCRNILEFNLTTLNTSKVTTMNAMFNGCSGLTFIDLSNFNTSKVTFMGSMFQNCSGLTSLDLSGFDVGNVTNFNIMFQSCSKLTSLDLSNFNMNSAASTSYMFYGCKALTEVKVANSDSYTQNKILTQLQTDLSSYTWTLGDDGIIRRS